MFIYNNLPGIVFYRRKLSYISEKRFEPLDYSPRPDVLVKEFENVNVSVQSVLDPFLVNLRLGSQMNRL